MNVLFSVSAITSNLSLLFVLCVRFRFNAPMQKFFTRRSKQNVANGNAAVGSELEDGNESVDDPSVPLLCEGKTKQTGFNIIIKQVTLYDLVYKYEIALS